MADPTLALIYVFDEDKSLSPRGGLGPDLTFARTSNGTYFDSGGILQTAGSGVARFGHDLVSPFTSRGILKEGAGTNYCLWNRDFTDVEWVKSNVTAAKDATGIDGSSNSASTLTATAANGTVLQTVTLAIDDFDFSIYIKRVTGSGNIDITDDDGANWTTLTGLSSSAWTRYDIIRNQANPVVGIRIAADTNKVAVDYAQVEQEVFSTSPIATTTATVTRAKDYVTTTTIDWYDQTQGTFYVRAVSAGGITTDWLERQFVLQMDGGGENISLWVNNNSPNGFRAGTVNTAGTDFLVMSDDVSFSTPHEWVIASAETDAAFYFDNTLVGTSGTVTQPSALSTLRIGDSTGSGYEADGFISELRYYNVRKANAFLKQLSNGEITETFGSAITRIAGKILNVGTLLLRR